MNGRPNSEIRYNERSTRQHHQYLTVHRCWERFIKRGSICPGIWVNSRQRNLIQSACEKKEKDRVKNFSGFFLRFMKDGERKGEKDIDRESRREGDNEKENWGLSKRTEEGEGERRRGKVRSMGKKKGDGVRERRVAYRERGEQE